MGDGSKGEEALAILGRAEGSGTDPVSNTTLLIDEKRGDHLDLIGEWLGIQGRVHVSGQT
jgi:hypothetical protein